MATRLYRSRALAGLRNCRPTEIRCFSTSIPQLAGFPTGQPDVADVRKSPREHIGTLKAPLVNPADKYGSKAENMHKYGSWIMGCLPKYVQQISVWKDELTIYVSPSGIIPLFSFLKCKYQLEVALRVTANTTQTTPRPSSPRSATSPLPTTRPETSALRSSTTSSVSATTPASVSRPTPTRPPPSPVSRLSSTVPTGTSVRFTTCLVSTSPTTPISAES